MVRKLYLSLITKFILIETILIAIPLIIAIPGAILVPLGLILSLIVSFAKLPPINLVLAESFIGMVVILTFYRHMIHGSVDFIGRYKYKASKVAAPNALARSDAHHCVECGEAYGEENEFCVACGAVTRVNKNWVAREAELKRQTTALDNITQTVFFLVLNYFIFGMIFSLITLIQYGFQLSSIPRISSYLFLLGLAIYHLVTMSRLTKSVVVIYFLWGIGSLAGFYLLWNGFVRVVLAMSGFQISEFGAYDVFSFVAFLFNILLLFFVATGGGAIKFIRQEDPAYLEERVVRNHAKNPYQKKTKTKYCTACGIQNDIGNRHCFRCGAYDEPSLDLANATGLFCNSCGGRLYQGNAFCRVCAKPVFKNEKDTSITEESVAQLKKAKTAFAGSVIVIFFTAFANIALGLLFLYLRTNIKALHLGAKFYEIFSYQAIWESLIYGAVFIVLGVFVMRRSLIALILAIGLMIWSNIEYTQYLIMVQYFRDLMTGVQARNLFYVAYFAITSMYVIPLLFGIRSILVMKKFGDWRGRR
ncbi:MAG: hypothetical protein WCL54_07965 [Clostridia bacterium]